MLKKTAHLHKYIFYKLFSSVDFIHICWSCEYSWQQESVCELILSVKI